MKETWKDPAYIRKRGLQLTAILAAVLLLIGWIVSDSWSTRGYMSESIARSALLAMPHDGLVVEQGLNAECEQLDAIVLALTPTASESAGSVTADIVQGGQVIASKEADLTGAGDELPLIFAEQPPTLTADTVLRLTFHAPEAGSPGALPALWSGDMVDVGKFTMEAQGLDSLTVDGEARHARLCMTVSGHSASAIMRWYWPVCGALVLLALALTLRTASAAKRQRRSLILTLLEMQGRYSFLLHQLVSRDFNTKYRQSLLGVLWSFLNPLLTMSVQYVIFSTIFKSSIPNFPGYLLTGIIFFNFFSESVNLGIDSIVANGSLITKVYMPKYIYPISRTVSSLINLVISLVPLLLLLLFTRTPITKAILLLPLAIGFLFCFVLGMVFILCTLNVFFRDTRFLWSVVVLLWTYATPIFYPETIVPASLTTLYHMNPMYQFIYFLRCIALDGVTPPPITYLYCTLCSLVPLLIGLLVFRKNQDKFVYHL